MGGGSMDYFYSKLESAANSFNANTLERMALRSHMLKLAAALHAVEWNDSGDGADDEDKLIRNCLAPREVFYVTLNEAKTILAALQKEIELAEKPS